MPPVVLKSFTGQGTDGRVDKAATICFPLWGAYKWRHTKI